MKQRRLRLFFVKFFYLDLQSNFKKLAPKEG